MDIINKGKTSIEGVDDTYLPTVKELIFSFGKDGLLGQGLSENLTPQIVEEPVVGKSGHFGNPNKSTLGRDMDGSQGERT